MQVWALVRLLSQRMHVFKQAERMGTGWVRAGLQREAGGGAACLGSGGSWRKRTTCPLRAQPRRRRRGRGPLPKRATAWPGACCEPECM